MSDTSNSDPHGHVMAVLGALGVPTAVIVGGVLVALLFLNILLPPSHAGKTSNIKETPELGYHVVPQ